ncbi:MAG: arsenate reductase ArsC [Proteobacteria bacterium]|nr:arsenate reductase ArsC [Pseudomonadota bacterium]
MGTKIKILFLCIGNSCRSQMAEGLTRFYRSNVIEPFSAGTKPEPLDPLAVEAMKEIGIDISGQRSKSVSEFKDTSFDYVITLCGEASESCPFFPAKTKIIHKGFSDPPVLARNEKTKEQKLVHYRKIRDEIKNYIMGLPENIL